MGYVGLYTISQNVIDKTKQQITDRDLSKGSPSLWNEWILRPKLFLATLLRFFGSAYKDIGGPGQLLRVKFKWQGEKSSRYLYAMQQ